MVAAAVLAPGKMPRNDINDLHVALGHSHADTCRETARQMGVNVFVELVACSGCSEAKGRRMAVPWRTECRSTRPLERLFVNLSGRRPPSAGDVEYIMMVVGDYSRLGWPYLLKRKSDVGCVRSDNGSEFVNPDIVGSLNTYLIHFYQEGGRCLLPVLF